MDETEALADRYLSHLGLGKPVYEPDGNVPPDFLVSGHIAVEVRRLNQNDPGADGPRGLEEDQIPLVQRMSRLLTSLGAPRAGRSWFVSYRLVRPLEPWKTLQAKVRQVLEDFATRSTSSSEPTDLGTALRISVHPASRVHPSMFVLGMFSDRDAGGWLLSEMERNLEMCIQEKTKKVQAFRAKYPVWWLVFVDHIGFPLGEEDRDVFSERVQVNHDWDRVVLVDPHDYTRTFDVQSQRKSGAG